MLKIIDNERIKGKTILLTSTEHIILHKLRNLLETANNARGVKK